MARRSGLGRVLGAVVTLPLSLLVIVFAITNRHLVAVGLWPFDGQAEMPLYFLALGALVLGFLAGSAASGFHTLAARLKARREARRADSAERRLAEAGTIRPPSSLPSGAALPPPRT